MLRTVLEVTALVVVGSVPPFMFFAARANKVLTPIDEWLAVIFGWVFTISLVLFLFSLFITLSLAIMCYLHG